MDLLIFEKLVVCRKNNVYVVIKKLWEDNVYMVVELM